MVIKTLAKKVYVQFIRIVRRDCIIHSKVKLSKACKLEGNNVIYEGCILDHVNMGFGSYLAMNCHIINTVIGRYTCIGSYVRTIIGRHPLSKNVSIHPAFYSVNNSIGYTYVDKQKYSEYKYLDGITYKSIEIGNDEWNGANVGILEGVKIGDGAVIGAGALVNKDVPPYAIVAGVPAKVIKYRFDEKVIKKLLSISWWNKSEKWIKENADSFENVDKFIALFEDEAH